MRKIFFDTNILLSKDKVDVFSELARICDFNYEVCVLDKTIDELKGKANGKLALSLINAKKVKIIKTKKDKNVDKLLLDLAEKDKIMIVVTQDKELKRLLKEKNINIVTTKQKKYLEFVN
ncbi:hypothetical protein J4409_00110 [Candidatus Woesearchaeota archaeon]|nr:hypothetical protein [Candidatus Woesearchaeota archaeon]